MNISFRRRVVIAALFLLASLGSGHAVTLLPQEQAIANDMISTPGQGRPALILDPVIEAVARARARDMAVRNYFAHVNPDGVAANYLLRQAGYQLPSWWGADPTANYVESIAAGYASPSDTWTSWMNSPPHKLHLLGQNSFFATETHYGVGYYADPDSTYQYYWVVITAPPEPVEIMSPEPGTRVASTAVAISGLADPSTNPASVRFRIENAAGVGGYQAATGIASWSGSAAGLVSGTNLIRAQSLDPSGSVLGETTCTFTCAIPATLNVAVSGSGSVSGGFAGATTQTVGQSLTIKARPAPGYVFAGWTGSIVSGSDSLTFTMEAGLSLEANFVPTPFLGVAGAYSGIVTTGTGAQSGLVKLTLSSSGLFTGRLIFPGGSYPFTGSLDLNGDATITIPGLDPITINLAADLTDDSGEITGGFTQSVNDYSFTISQSTFTSGTNSAPQAGRYTLVLSPNPSATGTSAPAGDGYATILVRPNGAAIVAGRLADGTPYSATGCVANDGTLAIYCVPSGAPAGSSLNGLLTFESTDVSDLDGTLAWTKAPRAADPFYPAGFSTGLPAVGSLYVRRSPAPQAGDAAPGDVGLGGGNLPQPVDVSVLLNPANEGVMVAPGIPNVTFKINPGNGAITGHFVAPEGNTAHTIRGAVLQKQNSAFGFFRGVNQCGYFSFTPE